MPRKKAEPKEAMVPAALETEEENIQGVLAGMAEETADDTGGKLAVELRIEQELEENETAEDRPALALKEPRGGVPANTYKPTNFYEADFRRLDRNLSDPEREEWNEIYASFRSKSILTGTVIGVDENVLPLRNPETKQIEMQTIYSLVIIGYRVKILIPENAVWVDGEERGTFLIRGMIGATVDYVITNIDREGECCLASRAMAAVKRRRAFLGNPRTAPKAGDIVKASLLVVGGRRCLLTCGGFDVPLWTREMSYTSILDMREVYRPGQELSAQYLGYDAENGNIGLSVKLATPNPFIGAERRHPVGRRRQAVISSKYKGGVFCALPDGTTVLCLYSNDHLDSEFLLGDSVIIYISQYDFKHQFIYGRIVSKW
jgi:ribosomal protein S1